MMRLSVFAVFVLAAVAFANPVARQDRQDVPPLGGDEVPGKRKCTKSGEKCAGAEGYPMVEYAACCDKSDLVCGTPKSTPKGLWGKFCIVESDAVSGSVGPGSSSPTTAAPGTTTASSGNTTTTSKSSSSSTKKTGAAGGTGTPDASGTPEADGPTTGGAGGSGAKASPTSESDDGSACFPGSATVELKDGNVVPMSELSVGDIVKVGPAQYSRVFMFTHKMADTVNKFVKLTTVSGVELSLTSGHYIYADGSLVAASQVSVGAEIRLGNGAVDTIASVSSVLETGLYNPQTVQGDVVVNGIISSTYTTAVEPSFAHAILAPFRSLYTLTGFQFTGLESGGGVLADVAPRGVAF